MCFVPEIVVVILMLIMSFFNMKNGTSWLSQSSYLIWIAYMSLLAYVCCKFLKEDIDNSQKIFYIKVLMAGTVLLSVISIVLGCYCYLIDDTMGLKSSIGVAILTIILAIVNTKRLKRYINEDHYDDD